MPKKKFKQAFTLLELLVVIAIIGILSSVVLASLASARERARDSTRISQLREVNKAVLLYKNKYGTLPMQSLAESDAQNEAFTGSHVTEAVTSYFRPWSEFEAELSEFMYAVPTDPINSSGGPPTVGAYNYRYYVNTQGEYMLITKFETENGRSCENQGYYLFEREGADSGEGSWCRGDHGKSLSALAMAGSSFWIRGL